MFLLPLTLLLCVGVGVYSMDEEMAELARMIREECVAQSGVDAALIARVNAGEPLMPDARLKCYVKCTMETAGMMADGAVDVEAILAVLPEPMRSHNEAIIRACGSQPGADRCDVAYNTQRCWQAANQRDYMLI